MNNEEYFLLMVDERLEDGLLLLNRFKLDCGYIKNGPGRFTTARTYNFLTNNLK